MESPGKGCCNGGVRVKRADCVSLQIFDLVRRTYAKRSVAVGIRPTVLQGDGAGLADGRLPSLRARIGFVGDDAYIVPFEDGTSAAVVCEAGQSLRRLRRHLPLHKGGKGGKMKLELGFVGAMKRYGP